MSIFYRLHQPEPDILEEGKKLYLNRKIEGLQEEIEMVLSTITTQKVLLTKEAGEVVIFFIMIVMIGISQLFIPDSCKRRAALRGKIASERNKLSEQALRLSVFSLILVI